MSNTVFVFGAGFSVPAGMPLQSEIIRNIVKRATQETVRHTIGNLFGIFHSEDMAEVPLEDIFTMLDRARNAQETIVGFTHQQIEYSYKTLINSITAEFDRRLSDFNDKPYRDFISELVKKRISNGKEEYVQRDASFCVITLNWDTILDYLISKIGGPHNVAIDYGCYDCSLEDREDHIPSIALRSLGVFAIRLLKLHGSLNWLMCASCGRLFSSNPNSDKPPVLSPYTKKCRFCLETDLESLIITPTLVKDLKQTHLNMVWHNALLELQEARRIVFVGYSFPVADFEFRYILLKAVTGNRDVCIRVVLYPPDEFVTSEREVFQRSEVERRYRSFLGHRDIDFRFMNAETFMTDPILVWHW